MASIKPDPDLKMEASGATPQGSGYMDDDFYEDTGELSLPPKDQPKDIWLTRIPDFLYAAVSKWDDLAEGNDGDQIVIGELLFHPDAARNGRPSKTTPMRVFLNDRWRSKTDLPTAFELQPTPATEDTLGNTYVFTEKDLPGYRPNGHGGPKSGPALQDPKARIAKRTRYKKAIPKQTALVGAASRQYTANPLPTREFIELSNARTRLAIQGNHMRTNIVDDTSFHAAGETAQRKFKAFIKSTALPKQQLNKAARIPKNELIDLLHSLFDSFQYWPMRTLKARTKQPEAYLKETLVDVAQLVKTGPFASCWTRMAMYKERDANAVGGKPPGDEDDGGVESGDEDMEDVV